MNARNERRRRVGAKAKGLARLPIAWVPSYVSVVPPSDRWHAIRGSADLDAELRERLSRLLDADRRLLVRSDGQNEGHWPGSGRTTLVDASWAGLVRGMRSALEADACAWPLVQQAVEPAAMGALSNERAVSPRRDLWVVEGLGDGLRPTVERLRATNGPVPTAALSASSFREVRTCLRVVARHLGGADLRYRCEWLWDGQRVWVVQADCLEPACTDPVAVQVLAHPRRWRLPSMEGPRDPYAENWQGIKAASWRRFSEHGWPTLPLHIRPAIGWDRDAGAEWLAGLCARYERPLVVRTDVTDRGDGNLLLPTSAPSEDADELADFIDAALERLVSQQGTPRACAALVSPLVPAVVSALVGASPSRQSVQVDALWGYPDGLLHLPHDTFTWSDGAIVRHIRHKPRCLVLVSGRSVQPRLAAPWDWRPTLNRAEVAGLARWAKDLATMERSDIQLMALCRIGGRRGPSACLPFHVSHLRGAGHETQLDITRHAFVVRGANDLGRIPLAARAIRLRPGPADLRDVGFLRAVGHQAYKRGAAILFSGSVLGHARYVLERTGAVVVPDTKVPSHDGVTVLARSPAGLLRLTYLDECAARRALTDELVCHGHEPPADSGLAALVDAVLRTRGSHPAFPTRVFLSDKISEQLAGVSDAPGQMARFMDDA